MGRTKRKAQLSLELLFVMGLAIMLLAASYGYVIPTENSPSGQSIRLQTLSSAKLLATQIGATVSTVSSQPPLAKTTTYLSVGYLAKPSLVSQVWGGASSLTIKITNQNVSVGIGNRMVFSGPTKNAVSVHLPMNINTTLSCTIPLNQLTQQLEIVAKSDPSVPSSSCNFNNGVLEITLKGG
jgi:hypothetical protein